MSWPLDERFERAVCTMQVCEWASNTNWRCDVKILCTGMSKKKGSNLEYVHAWQKTSRCVTSLVNVDFEKR